MRSRRLGAWGALVVVAGVVLGACTPSTSVSTHALGEQDVVVVSLRGDRRTAVARPAGEVPGGPPRIVVCSEPAPDAVITTNIDASQALLLGAITAQHTDAPGALDIESTLRVIESITALGERTQAMGVQREALFRLCEMSANGMLTPYRAWLVFDEILSTLRLVAIADMLRGDELAVDSQVLTSFIEANIRRVPVDRVPSNFGGQAADETGAVGLIGTLALAGSVCAVVTEDRGDPARLIERLEGFGQELIDLATLYAGREDALVALLTGLCGA